MNYVPVGTVMEFPTETFEVTATPETTSDRYRIRVTAPPEGGPGIQGDGPHTHPGLIELFEVVSGQMTARIGKDLLDMKPGDKADVPAGVVHGFVNSGTKSLILDVEVVYTPPGPRPEADAVTFAQIVAGLIADGHVNKRTGYPNLAQMAVMLEDRFPEGMSQPGLSGLLMRPLAVWGRLRGYRSEFPEYES